MPSALARLARRMTLRLVPRAQSGIRTFPDGFATRDVVVPWDDVSRVLAFPGEGGMRIEVRASHLEEAVVLAQTQPGFDAFVRMADRRLTFPLAWWEGLPRARRVVLFEAGLHEVPACGEHAAARTANG
ncbi:hypothetical protein NX784_19955 [Massilia pinisoli]|uniref:Uncharacterized protein n=1 Tax=Massilia pinisoli TaxID=1772194 RepID=A0ABT1ZVG4_9BURK|nr:hypothetical protein [Massilia pinisoli]MCS0583874.1 hypothetical protein [Massilia pinisoli]